MRYDLIVIGGGPAGYAGAEKAVRGGMKTLLVEKGALGGVCLNEGCIPSKTLLYSAKMHNAARQSRKYGVDTAGVSYDHERVLQRKRKVVKNLGAGLKNRLEKRGVELMGGRAVISGRGKSSCYLVGVDGRTYEAERLLIAAGSVSAVPSIPGLEAAMEDGFVLTSGEILDLAEVPDSLAVIGGGYIGLEMAAYFHSAGSRVTVIEMLGHIAGDADGDIGRTLLDIYRTQGIEFRLGARVTGITDGAVVCDHDGKEVALRAGKVLLSAGRTPAAGALGLETIGVEIEGGAVKTDGRGQTNQPGVYAAGDVNGKYMLAHVATREAEVCINNMMGIKDRMSYKAIPSVIYTDPESAAAGETEAGAARKGIEFESVSLPMIYSGRYFAENEERNGVAKVLIDKKHRTLLGVHLVGTYASEIIYGASMMIENEMRIDDIREMVFPHPTVAEIIREAVLQSGL